MSKTKLQRNDPCPCGSGRKFKACCLLDKATTAPATTTAESLIAAANQALRRGQVQQARGFSKRAVLQDPGNHAAWRTAAQAALDAKRFTACADLSRKAMHIDEADCESRYLLGTALGRLGRFEAAQEHLQAVVAKEPGHWRAWNNLGNVLRESGHQAAALECFARLFAIEASPASVLSNVLSGMQGQDAVDHEALFAMQCSVGARIEAEAGAQMAYTPRQVGAGPIRLGYFSPRFKPGVIGDFFLPLYDAHDRSRFAIYLYSDLEGRNECTDHLSSTADGWRQTRGMTDAQLARQVQKDGVDIFIDLAGHSPGNRLGAFARKPAPVQVSMIDSFDTTGMTAIDYFVSDGCASPPDSGQRFTERLLRLSSPRLIYRPSGEAVAVATAPALRNGYVTFGSFNRVEKINTAVIELWAEILSQVPGARLILKDRNLGSDSVAESFRRGFRERGIEPSRLEFRGWSDHRRLLEEYGDVDIALDPFPYNGGLTTCEALWMGVPVVALLGARIIGRQSACFLRAAGLDDFVGQTNRGYVERAVHWAGQLEALANLRRTLRQRVAGSALMDARRYARELEEEFITIIRGRHTAG